MEQIRVGPNRVAIIDQERVADIRKFTWHSQAGKAGTFYVYRRDGKTKIYLHRWIIGAAPGERVDHINGNGLDNRLENLRICSNVENMRNMRRGRGVSRHKGVAWFHRDAVWRSYIVVAGRQLHLGYFDEEIMAAKAYNNAALCHFGEFANLNVLENSP